MVKLDARDKTMPLKTLSLEISSSVFFKKWIIKIIFEMRYSMYLNLGFSVLNNFSLKKKKKKGLKTSRAGTCCQGRNNQKCLQVADPGHLSLVLNSPKLEASPVAEGENNATLRTASPKQGIPSYLCLV